MTTLPQIQKAEQKLSAELVLNLIRLFIRIQIRQGFQLLIRL